MVNEVTILNLEKQFSAKVFFALFLSASLATFMWVYYLSQGFSQPGILDAFIDIQAYAFKRVNSPLHRITITCFIMTLASTKGTIIFIGDSCHLPSMPFFRHF